jgi:hypothetical protein
MGTRRTFRFQNYTVAHNPDSPFVGAARCEEVPCTWTSRAPLELDALTKAMGEHTRESGHTAFLRTVSDVVTVVPGEWDGE